MTPLLTPEARVRALEAALERTVRRLDTTHELLARGPASIIAVAYELTDIQDALRAALGGAR